MTEKEKEAIGRIKYNDISRPLACGDLTICNIEDLNIVLNLIQKQQEEIEKKDEQINELEDKLSLIEEYYDISDLEQIIKEDM